MQTKNLKIQTKHLKNWNKFKLKQYFQPNFSTTISWTTFFLRVRSKDRYLSSKSWAYNNLPAESIEYLSYTPLEDIFKKWLLNINNSQSLKEHFKAIKYGEGLRSLVTTATNEFKRKNEQVE